MNSPAVPPDDVAEFLSGAALFVALLVVVFLAMPCWFLYAALRERGLFDRLPWR